MSDSITKQSLDELLAQVEEEMLELEKSLARLNDLRIKILQEILSEEEQCYSWQ